MSTPMSHDFGISLLLLHPIAEGLRRIGGDDVAFLRALGVDAHTPADFFAPAARVDAALQESARGLGDPALGLSVARALPPGSFGAWDYLMGTSSTAGEALQRTARYYGLLSRRATLEITEAGGTVRIDSFPRAGAPPSIVLTELALALVFFRARALVGDRLSLRGVHFAHQVSNPAAHISVFGRCVKFGQPNAGIELDADFMAVPIPTHDQETGMLLEQRLAELGAAIGAAETLVDRVRAAILRQLREGRPSLASLAREMGTSSRSLQRQLQEQGTSHSELVDDVRRQFAMQRLAQDDKEIVTVAYDLGYRQLASFHRAFGRWTGGTTPGAYRANAARQRSSAP